MQLKKMSESTKNLFTALLEISKEKKSQKREHFQQQFFFFVLTQQKLQLDIVKSLKTILTN